LGVEKNVAAALVADGRKPETTQGKGSAEPLRQLKQPVQKKAPNILRHPRLAVGACYAIFNSI